MTVRQSYGTIDMKILRNPLGRTAALAAGVIVLFASAGVSAADLAAGEKVAETTCAACHGKDGNTPIDPSYAKLAGQHRDYLVIALKEYRDDRRKNAIMGAQAKQLSAADVENVAAWFASLPGDLRVRK